MEKETQTILEGSYFEDLNQIKKTINANRNKAMIVVNSAMIITYYQIGKIINQRNEWGTKYVQRLANDLKEYGSGYSFDQLMRMSQFANIFTDDDILAQPVPKIPWGTTIKIIQKSSSREEMLWYINQTYQNRWSRREVLQQFEMKAFQRSLIEPQMTEKAKTDGVISDVFKDTLALNFINQNDLDSEKSLKNKLIDNIIQFLQELGPGFALVGKEYKLTTTTNKNFYIDLLMYHTKIHAYIAIEVKMGEFDPRDIGQLNFYVNALNDLEKTDVDNDSAGILLCKEADSYVVKASLVGIQTSIGISKYKVIEELPEYLERRLMEK